MSAQKIVGPREANWVQGTTLLSQQVLPTMGPLLLVPVVPLIIQEYGTMPGADYWVPALLTVPALCIALFSFFAGAIGDRFGRRYPLILALVLYGAAGMAPLVLTSFPAVFASRILLGVCEALIATLSMTLLGDYFSGARRDRWLALIATVGAGSAILFLALSGAVGGAFGWRAPTAIYGLAFLVVPAMLLWTWEPRRHAVEVVSPAEPFPLRHVLLVGAATLIGGTYFFMVAIQQAFGLVEMGVTDPGRIGLLTAIAGFGNPIGSLIFRRLVTAKRGLLIGVEMVLIGGGLIGMSQAPTDIMFCVSAFVASLGAGMLMPTLITWMIGGLPYSARGRGAGIFQSTFCFGQFASGLVLPFMAHTVVGGVLPAFGVFGLVALGLAVAAFLFSRARPKLQNAPADLPGSSHK